MSLPTVEQSAERERDRELKGEKESWCREPRSCNYEYIDNFLLAPTKWKLALNALGVLDQSHSMLRCSESQLNQFVVSASVQRATQALQAACLSFTCRTWHGGTVALATKIWSPGEPKIG